MHKGVTLVTGGSRGIGNEIARSFARKGMNIAGNFTSLKATI
jgi:NAD(P)-dependent dehydrogenase (short-subunit alcohol dehydrogenase family)